MLGLCALGGALALSSAPALAAQAPKVEEQWVADVSATSVTLAAKVNPEESATSYRFEYATSEAALLAGDGEEFPAPPRAESEAGAGTEGAVADGHVQGLQPDTRYWYRIVAKNGEGEASGCEVAGSCESFTSEPAGGEFALPDGRAWELVSPPDKHGSAIYPLEAEDGVIQAAEDGSGIAYIAAGPIATEGHEPEGNHAYEPAQILSKRTPNGWETQDVYTPRNPAIGRGAFSGSPEYVMFSPDLSLGLVEPRAKDPLPPLPETAEESVYLRHEEGAFEALVTAENVFEGAKSRFGVQAGRGSPGAGVTALAGTPELNHVVLQSQEVALVEDAVGSVEGASGAGLYEWTAGESATEPLKLVSVLPGGDNPGSGHTSLGGADSSVLRHTISEDGERVVWGAGDGEDSEAVYLRENALQPQSPLVDGAAAGTGRLENGSDEVTGVTPTSGSFQVGQTIAQSLAPGAIPANTTITGKDGSTLILSAAATITTGSEAVLEAFSPCKVRADACTVQVSGGVASYQTASIDGSRVFYKEDGHLYVFTDPVGEGPPASTVDLTEGVNVEGAVIGASDTGEYVYLVTAGALNPSENPGKTVAGAENENARGQKPEGDWTLYVIHYEHEKWKPTFIANLTGADSPDWAGDREGATGTNLTGLTARVSPDGQRLAFMSQERITGYDNTDINSGAADEEVYEYDALSNRTVCASCNPTGERPTGVFDPIRGGPNDALLVDEPQAWEEHWLAASIPGWTAQTLHTALYQSRYLDDDGRLFFDSSDTLAPADVNDEENVYEFDPEGLGDCSSGTANPAEVYSPGADGCVGLISSGASGQESAFLDASGLNPTTGQEGEDVFFMTSSKLVSRDVDTAYDVYDAHACSSVVPCAAGAVAVPPACTTADSCRAAPTPQPEVFGAPASQTFSGSGNLVPAPSAAPVSVKATAKVVKCRRGFVRKHNRCVKKSKTRDTKVSEHRRGR